MKLPILVVNSFNCGICVLDNHTGEPKRDFVAERWTYRGRSIEPVRFDALHKSQDRTRSL
jgi:hypothetical protein